VNPGLENLITNLSSKNFLKFIQDRVHEGIELLRKGKGIKVIIYPKNDKILEISGNST